MMKQLFLTFMAVGMLATASWAGSEVEPPVEVKPDWLVILDGDDLIVLDDCSKNCIQIIVLDPNSDDGSVYNETNCF